MQHPSSSSINGINRLSFLADGLSGDDARKARVLELADALEGFPVQLVTASKATIQVSRYTISTFHSNRALNVYICNINDRTVLSYSRMQALRISKY